MTPTEKLIKPYECSFIVIEGPNLKGKLSLEGLEIKYDSFNLAQMTLNEGAKDQPLLYGFLGTDITFLMIRAKFMPVDQYWQVETEQYVEYYFKDNPDEIRTMGQIAVFSGNSAKRIPQMFLNNPSQSYKIQLEILMANLPQSDIENSNQYKKDSYFNGLYYNSIISNQVYYTIPTNSTGSTELKILDYDSVPVMIIPYSNIRKITKIGTNVLSIGNDTDEKIKLEFLSEYNCDQANSRINWVLESISNRYLTKNTIMDIEPPIITWSPYIQTGITTGITSGITEIFILPSGYTYSLSGLTNLLITEVFDSVDGIMDINRVNLILKQYNDFVPLTEIIDVGIYELFFEVKDLANNTFTDLKYLSVI